MKRSLRLLVLLAVGGLIAVGCSDKPPAPSDPGSKQSLTAPGGSMAPDPPKPGTGATR